MTEVNQDFPVSGHNRVSKTGKRHVVKPHERKESPKKSLLRKVKHLKATKKKIDPQIRTFKIKILNEDLKQLKKSMTKARKEERINDLRLLIHEIDKKQERLDKLMFQKMGLDLIPVMTEDYPVQAHTRKGKPVKAHTRGGIVKDKEILERIRKYKEQQEKDKKRSQEIIKNKDKKLKATKIVHKKIYHAQCSLCKRQLKKAVHTNKGIMGYRCYLNCIGLPSSGSAQLSFKNLPKETFEQMSEPTIEMIETLTKNDLINILKEWMGKIDNIEFAEQTSHSTIVYKEKGEYNKAKNIEFFGQGSRVLAKVIGILPQVFDKIIGTESFNKWRRDKGQFAFADSKIIIGKEIINRKRIETLEDDKKNLEKIYNELTGSDKFTIRRKEELTKTINRLNDEIIGLKRDFILIPVVTPFMRTDAVPFSEFKQLKTDFSNQDFVIFHGPIARDGPYDYEENGKIRTLYKDIENLSDIYSRYKYLPIKASELVGAHHAEELGYGTNFSLNKETNEIEADLVLVNDESFKEILSKKNEYHVSPGYNDVVKGNIQIITDLDHIALALGNEIGRSCTGTNSKGSSCTKVIKINHNQNLTEVV